MEYNCLKSAIPSTWKKKLKENKMLNLMWNLIYTNDKHVTKDTSLSNFQFKVTHRILARNYNLKIWKIKETNVCNQCEEIDTI